MNDTLQLILQAGALGVLVLVLGGLGYLLIKVGPQITAFLTGLVQQQAATAAALSALTAEIRVSNAAMVTRTDLSESRIKGYVTDAAVAIQDTVRDRATSTGEQVTMTVDRAVDVLRRQPTDPNLSAYVDRPVVTPPASPRPRPGERRQ